MTTRSLRLVRGRAIPFLCALAALVVVVGCEEKPPAKMALRPKGPLVFTNLGKSETVELAFFDDKGRPYVRKPTATFGGHDTSIIDVTVDAESTRATVKPKASGTTDVLVEAFGLEQKLTVTVTLVGSVAFAEGTPAKMKMGETHQLALVVKDDRGNPLTDAKPNFKASDYCVDVSPDGLVTAQAQGECSVAVDVAGKTARHKFSVK